jgi:hypothetical protein
LQKPYLENPRSAAFKIDDVVLLGETSRREIDDLIIKYRSPDFEVVRGNERTFPSWVFGYPERWYPGLRDQMQCAADLCSGIPEEDWRYIFDLDEAGAAVAALCVIQVTPPSGLLGRLSKHQADFCRKLQRNLQGVPNVPDIFLTVLSDFVEAVIDDRQDYSPVIYNEILFPKPDYVNPFSERTGPFPLGSLDPLNLVANLVETLTSLWEKRSNTALKEFSSFRFGGLGLLQARRNDDVEWTTILAYCGGTEYERDEDGKIVISEAGRPRPKGKCGHAPLVLGSHQTCPNCRKLLCHRCGFCSVACRDQAFRALARDGNNVARTRKSQLPKDGGRTLEAPPWELVPLKAYEDYLR